MTWKNWGDHPLVASISVISGLAGIVALGLALRQPNLPTPLAEPMLQGQYSRFADVPNLPVGLFNYGGSTSWASVRSEIDPEIQKSQPNFKLRYVHPINGQPSSGTGIRMLLDGELAFAQSSRPLSDKAIQEAKVRGITLKQIPVAINGIAIIVHPDLKLAGLTIEQLRAIYTGQVQNWQELGGSDLPIVPFHRIQASGGNTNFFLNDDEELGTNTRHVSTPTEGVQRVAKTLGGIYYGSAAILASQCSVRVLPIGRRVGESVPLLQEPLVPASQCSVQNPNQINRETLRNGRYPLSDSLFVVVNQNGGIQQQAGEAYAKLLLSQQGQSRLEQLGFVKIR